MTGSSGSPRPVLADGAALTRGFAAAAQLYVERGWHPVAFRRGEKWPPPKGFTGRDGRVATPADLQGWAERFPDGNIGLRLPKGVLGLDVDDYDPKQGGRTLRALEAELGPLPSTCWSTSRSDAISGIRCFRVPHGVQWRGEASFAHPDGFVTKDIELIHWGLRYAMVAPSVHPDGRVYRWIGDDGVELGEVPDVDSLPSLPEPWVDELTKGAASRAKRRASGPAGSATAGKWALLPTREEPICPGTARWLQEALDTLEASSRHEAIRNGCLRLLRAAEVGHLGVPAALRELQTAFLAAATNRTQVDAEQEWERAYAGAHGLIGKPFRADRMCDCARAAYDVALRQTNGFSKGVGGNGERELLRVMVSWSHGRWYVRRAQRQLAEDLRKKTPSVGRVCKRLIQLGWIEKTAGRRFGEAAGYRLLRTPVLDELLTAEQSAAAGLSAVNRLTATPSLLYAGTGLGRGPAETLSLLPAMTAIRVNDRLLGLRLARSASGESKGSAGFGLAPMNFRPGQGARIKDVAAESGKAPKTVSTHLKKLQRLHLVLRDRRGTWWRLDFEADAVAAEYMVLDKQPHLKAEHERDRRLYYGGIARLEGGDQRVQVLDSGGPWLAVDTQTGQVLSSADTEDEKRELALGDPVRARRTPKVPVSEARTGVVGVPDVADARRLPRAGST